jgi:hypothetical protein
MTATIAESVSTILARIVDAKACAARRPVPDSEHSEARETRHITPGFVPFWR